LEGAEMSREFGSYHGGYFHDKISNAAEDCRDSSCKLTTMWGEFLETFHSVAYEISNYEASDSGLYAPIFESMAKLPMLKKKLEEIDAYLYDYKRIAEEAVRKHCEGKKP
jgi:hypothetical protein